MRGIRALRRQSAKVAVSASTAFLAAGAALVGGAGEANALAFAPFAGDTPEANSVVRIVLPATRLSETACTGTAIGPHWVLTAGHCANPSVHGGTVETGQRGHTQKFTIDRMEVNRDGDLAMLHVDRDMDLGFYPRVNFTTPATGTPTTVYGWSTWGQGITGSLPTARLSIADCPGNFSQCASGQFLLAKAQLPTILQPGDSGGPMFVDGGVVGVMSSSASFNSLPVEVTGLYFYTRLQAHQYWVNTTLAS